MTPEKVTPKFTKEQALVWIRDFLNEVDTQDNRCTAKPIMFFLQTKNEYVAHDEFYGSNTRTVFRHPRMEGETCDSLDEAIKWVKEYYEDELRQKREIEKIEEFQMGYYWETQEVFFTEKGIERHLELNRHNYRRGYRDYVIHAFRNPEISELFDVLRTLVVADEALMETKTQTELEKRVEEAACKLFLKNHTTMEEDFKAGAKFILEMPEFKELVEVLEDLSQPLTNTAITIGQFDDYVTDRANKALTKWREFLGEGEK